MSCVLHAYNLYCHKLAELLENEDGVTLYVELYELTLITIIHDYINRNEKMSIHFSTNNTLQTKILRKQHRIVIMYKTIIILFVVLGVACSANDTKIKSGKYRQLFEIMV